MQSAETRDEASRKGAQAHGLESAQVRDEVVVLPERGPGDEQEEDADFEEVEEVSQRPQPVFHQREFPPARGSWCPTPLRGFDPPEGRHDSIRLPGAAKTVDFLACVSLTATFHLLE